VEKGYKDINEISIYLHNFEISILLRVFAPVIIHAQVLTLVEILLIHVVFRPYFSNSTVNFAVISIFLALNVTLTTSSFRLVETSILLQVFVGLLIDMSGSIRGKLGNINADLVSIPSIKFILGHNKFCSNLTRF
jgi:hypothetical protein